MWSLRNYAQLTPCRQMRPGGQRTMFMDYLWNVQSVHGPNWFIGAEMVVSHLNILCSFVKQNPNTHAQNL